MVSLCSMRELVVGVHQPRTDLRPGCQTHIGPGWSTWGRGYAKDLMSVWSPGMGCSR
jgi:hypothetical protein